jgi:hypothetical protein
LVEPLLALTIRFILASCSSWRNIMNSASAIAFVVAIAKAARNIQVVLHEVLAPLP